MVCKVTQVTQNKDGFHYQLLKSSLLSLTESKPHVVHRRPRWNKAPKFCNFRNAELPRLFSFFLSFSNGGDGAGWPKLKEAITYKCMWSFIICGRRVSLDPLLHVLIQSDLLLKPSFCKWILYSLNKILNMFWGMFDSQITFLQFKVLLISFSYLKTKQNGYDSTPLYASTSKWRFTHQGNNSVSLLFTPNAFDSHLPNTKTTLYVENVNKICI